MSRQPLVQSIAIFSLLFLYLCAWAVIKPPFQSPDEFNHAIKAYSVARNPFITPDPEVKVPRRFMNPLLEAEILHRMPFHRAVSISDIDVQNLKRLDWSTGVDEETRVIGMYNYPFLYYQTVFVLGQGGSALWRLSPYDSVFLYRIATALLAALMWLSVFRSLPQELPYRGSVFLFLVLNPMLAFISSSINVDALLYPLSCLVIIGFYRLGFHERERGFLALSALVSAGLTKASALVFFPALALGSGAIFFRSKAFRLRPTVWVGLAALVVVWVSFYLWVPRPDHTTYVGVPVHMGVWDYINKIPSRELFQSYWGVLGWLDFRLAPPYYRLLALLLTINAVLVLMSGRKWLEAGFTWYAMLVSALFSAGLLAVEYLLLPRYGFVLQGRYFLPVSLGLAMLLVHRWSWVRYTFLVYLIVFSSLLFHESVDRFYDGDWERVWRAHPFIPPAVGLPGRATHFQASLFSPATPATRVDGILDAVSREGPLVKLWGWTPLRSNTGNVQYQVFTAVLPDAIEGRREYRPDVARVLNDAAYRKSGFAMTLIFPDEAAADAAAKELCVLAWAEDATDVLLLHSGNDKCRKLLQGSDEQGGSGIPLSRLEKRD